MIGNNIDIVLIPPSTKRVVKLRMPISSLFLIGFVLVGAFFYSTYVYARYFEKISQYNAYKEIQKSINFQKIQLKKLSIELSKSNQKLDGLKKFDKKIRIITGQEDTLASASKIKQRLQPSTEYRGVNSASQTKTSQDEVIINGLFLMLDVNMQDIRNSFFMLESIIQENRDKLSRTPFIIPLKVGHLTSRYGMRNDPFTGIPRMHYGVDWAYLPYTAIYAPADGIVKDTVKSFSYGNFLIINHGYGIVTRYAHLAKIEVKKSQRIKRGQLIGRMGGTGARSTAVHLHYEIKVNNKFVNPENYLINGLNISRR